MRCWKQKQICSYVPTRAEGLAANFALTQFSEDEMRRPTLETQYLMVCKRYTGSEAQSKGGSAHHGC
jgi:hypothetical protein